MGICSGLFFRALGRDFRKNKNRFFTIFFLAALGIMVSLSLFLGTKALGEAFHRQYVALQWMHGEITSPFPLTQGDVDALSQWEQVAVAEGAYSVDLEIMLMSGNLPVRAVSLSQEPINLLSLELGRLPETTTECVISLDFSRDTGLTVGDHIRMGATEELYLKEDQFVIVGVGQSAQYLSSLALPSKLSTVRSQIYLSKEAFFGDYHSIFVRLHQEEADSLAEGWAQATDTAFLADFAQAVEEIGAVQCDLMGELELERARAWLMEAEEALALQEQLTQGELQAMVAELNALEATISVAWLESGDSPGEMESIAQLEQDYVQGLFAIQNKEIQVEDFLDGFRKVCQEAERSVALLEEGQWSLSTRKDQAVYLTFLDDLGYLQRLSYSLPWIFLFIYCIISYFLLARTVEEERRIMGTLFSLGYGKCEVFSKYLWYVSVPTVLGAMVAILLANSVAPYWMFLMWTERYLLGDYALVPQEGLTSATVLGFWVGGMVMSVLPCLPLVQTSPLQLLRSKPPVIGKHVLLEKNYLLWNELNFHQKIAVRSFFRHKMRFVVQVTSIGSSCALIVTAFALERTFQQMTQLQYEEIYRYNTEITLEPDIISWELLEIQGILSQYQLNNDYSLVMTEELALEAKEGTVLGELYVFEDAESVQNSIYLRMGQWLPYNMPETGLVLAQKLGEMGDWDLGDSLILSSHGGAESFVSALHEQYVGMRIYTTSSYWEQCTGEQHSPNMILLNIPQDILDNEERYHNFLHRLLGMKGVASVLQLSQERETYTEDNHFIIYFLRNFGPFSCLLAYFVLFQLCQNSLSFRRRELATLKVLGLYDRELSAYVYRENMFYSFFGTTFGIVLGLNLYQLIIKSLESSQLMLYRVIDFPVYLEAYVLTIVFAILVNIQAHFQIKKLDMVEEIKLAEE